MPQCGRVFTIVAIHHWIFRKRHTARPLGRFTPNQSATRPI